MGLYNHCSAQAQDTMPETPAAVLPTEPDAAAPAKRKFRRRSATVAKREIKKYQKTTENLVPRGTFNRIIREIAADFKSDLRFSREALEAIQVASEEHMTRVLRRAMRNANHARRSTIQAADMHAINDDDGGDIAALTGDA